MKAIYDIALTELKKLFYSPVAWLILVIYAFAAGYYFTGLYKNLLAMKISGQPLAGLTSFVFANSSAGFYKHIPDILYMFIPLLTMNIISRDKSSGAIKLLLSSPLSNRQIILGKYLSLVIFSLIMVLITAFFSFFGLFSIENADVPVVFSGLLGIFLLACIYSAIGLFMSSITTYPIVAAIGTLVVLVTLQYAGYFGQEIAFIRDVTYWLSLKGRVSTFIIGLITSEDLVYYFAVIGFFLALTLIRMKAARSKKSRLHIAGQYTLATLAMAITGYFTSMPSFKLYWDVTRSQYNTLSKESQKVMSKMDGGLKIHTYTNMLDGATSYSALPSEYKLDVERFDQYTRFKPETELDYTYYFKKVPGWFAEKYPNLTEQQLMDTLQHLNEFSFDIVPYKNIDDKVDLSGEQFRFVRTIEREDGRKTFLRIFDDTKRYPEEAQITASLKRLVDNLPKVGFITGHGERSASVENEKGYNMFAQEKTFRYSLLNSGFDFESVSLTAPVPDHITILVLADPRRPFAETEIRHYNDYINRGGNLIICGEPGRQEIINPVTAMLGVRFLPGTLMQPKENTLPEILSSRLTQDSTLQSPWISMLRDYNLSMVMNGACALETKDSTGFRVNQLFVSDTIPVWSELETTDFLNDSAFYNPAAGEVKQSYFPVLSLARNINSKEQKIIVTGDADWLSNGELNTRRRSVKSGNFAFICAAFYWLSDGLAPINTERAKPIDNSISTTRESWKIPQFIFRWGIPLILLATGIIFWIRRKGR